MTNLAEKSVAIIIPCFNENRTVIRFLNILEESIGCSEYIFKVIIVDDCSTDNTLDLLKNFSFQSSNLEIILLTLRINMGHQGAIYQGMLFAESLNTDKFIVMDADGEDDPTAIHDLLGLKNKDIVHVIRRRRSVGIIFKILYYVYKVIFRLITGKSMNFGNYCLISRKVLENILQTSFIHFAAHLLKQKVNSAHIVIDRKKRLEGKSKMNLSSLIYHAMGSLVEFAEDLLMIFLKLFIIIGIVFFGLIGFVLYQKLFTDKAIIGWASTLSTSLFNTAIICLGFFVIGVLLLNIQLKKDSANRKAIYRRIK